MSPARKVRQEFPKEVRMQLRLEGRVGGTWVKMEGGASRKREHSRQKAVR